jgi:hypothetical protein
VVLKYCQYTNDLKILPNKDKPTRIRNVVWKEVLSNVNESLMELETARKKEDLDMMKT